MNLVVKVFIGLSMLLMTSMSSATIIYSNDFESSVGAEWSSVATDITPVGNRQFLGQFLNETVSLSLDNLQAHSLVTLSFDLFIINSWDGNFLSAGPDNWSLAVSGGPTLLQTTFSNTEEFGGHEQSYSASNANGSFAAGTDASEIDSLGYSFYGDSVYQLSFTFAHAASDVQFDFSAFGLQTLADESWGLDNVKVSTDAKQAIPEPSTILLLSLAIFFLIRRLN